MTPKGVSPGNAPLSSLVHLAALEAAVPRNTWLPLGRCQPLADCGRGTKAGPVLGEGGLLGWGTLV